MAYTYCPKCGKKTEWQPLCEHCGSPIEATYLTSAGWEKPCRHAPATSIHPGIIAVGFTLAVATVAVLAVCALQTHSETSRPTYTSTPKPNAVNPSPLPQAVPLPESEYNKPMAKWTWKGQAQYARADGTIWADPRTYQVGADQTPIVLHNNSNATDVTYAALVEFIMRDETNEHLYSDNSYVCADFAQDLHNNAEANGIKAAWVGISGKDPDGNEFTHALNAFHTTDYGYVFIDDTPHECEQIDWLGMTCDLYTDYSVEPLLTASGSYSATMGHITQATMWW